MNAEHLEQLRNWIGKTESSRDVVAPAAIARLSAVLDYCEPRVLVGDALPPAWHWLFFLPAPAASVLGSDGHPRRGDFLPPITLPRRMWAGSDMRFLQRVEVGDEIRRESEIADVIAKQGRSGGLVFVHVMHKVYRGEQLAIEETQNIVYRDGVDGAPAQAKEETSAQTRKKPLAQAQWSRTIEPDNVLLFRYSALTFNSHRIHYDWRYAVEEEGYDDLVVQGPLTAILLLDLLHREIPAAQLESFSFRGVKPLLAGRTLQLQGRRDDQLVSLWALDAAGALAMEARAQLSGG